MVTSALLIGSGLRGMLGVLAGIAILALVNASILDKEKLLSEGQVVYLELAPVDPRSLMQGDYKIGRAHV